MLLVRHGHAASKREWQADDKIRPLDEQGLVEAEALVPFVASLAPARILSSPFLRCTQSMGPLSQALGLEIENSASLTPEAGTAARKLVLGVSAHASGPVVVCTHGEVIHDLQSNLGKHAPSNFNAQAQREKGSIWVLERSSGRFVSAHYMAPSWCLPSRPRARRGGEREPGRRWGRVPAFGSAVIRVQLIDYGNSLMTALCQTAGHSARSVLRRARSPAISW